MGATQLSQDCPHCGSRKAAFTFEHVRQTRQLAHTCFGTAYCGVCDAPIILHYLDKTISVRGTNLHLPSVETEFPGLQFVVLRTWPEDGEKVPGRLPDNIASFFRQGITNEAAGNWDAAGAMFRKALDVATKTLDQANAGQTLFRRIDALASAGRLTEDLAAWAHEVRIEGNASVHDDDPETPGDVAAIHEFARAVLMYTFTLPALVASRSSADGAST